MQSLYNLKSDGAGAPSGTLRRPGLAEEAAAAGAEAAVAEDAAEEAAAEGGALAVHGVLLLALVAGVAGTRLGGEHVHLAGAGAEKPTSVLAASVEGQLVEEHARGVVGLLLGDSRPGQDVAELGQLGLVAGGGQHRAAIHGLSLVHQHESLHI